jgi:hypothetical protein
MLIHFKSMQVVGITLQSHQKATERHVRRPGITRELVRLELQKPGEEISLILSVIQSGTFLTSAFKYIKDNRDIQSLSSKFLRFSVSGLFPRQL